MAQDMIDMCRDELRRFRESLTTAGQFSN